MTELNREKVLAELDAVIARNTAHLTSKGPVSSATAQARHELAHTMKADIESGVYDVPGSAARAFYLTTIKMSWAKLTPRERKRLWRLDSLLQIAIRHLATDDLRVEETEEEPLATPKAKSPWTWPLWALIGLLVIVLGGTTLALIYPA